MKPLLVATHNEGKLKEISSIIEKLYPKRFNLFSLNDKSITSEPVENGKNFCENSLIKAKYYAKIAQIPVIVDDAGLEINALHGEPGIHSRRWPGHKATDEELIYYALKKMANIPTEKRGAQLTTCLSYFDPDSHILIQRSMSIKGIISKKASEKRYPGYPYKSLFIVSAYKKFYGELTEQEHKEINHRHIALSLIFKKVV